MEFDQGWWDEQNRSLGWVNRPHLRGSGKSHALMDIMIDDWWKTFLFEQSCYLEAASDQNLVLNMDFSRLEERVATRICVVGTAGQDMSAALIKGMQAELLFVDDLANQKELKMYCETHTDFYEICDPYELDWDWFKDIIYERQLEWREKRKLARKAEKVYPVQSVIRAVSFKPPVPFTRMQNK